MAQNNTSTDLPGKWVNVWPSAVGADTTLAGADGQAFRRVVVGNVVGPLVLLDASGDEVTFAATHINALGGVLDGQWSGVKASGSTSYNLLCGQ